MAQDFETILKNFQIELTENDKIVQQEINSKSRTKMSKEFADFIKNNNCKIKKDRKKLKGGTNGKI